MAQPTPIFPSPPATNRRLVAVLALALSTLCPPVARTQTDHPGHFSGDERVIAIDVVVEVEPSGAKRLRPRRSDAAILDRLAAEDFEIRVGGETQTAILAENPNAKGTEKEPWQIVLYLDAELSSRLEVAAAARRLSDVAGPLVTLGEVTLILATSDGAHVELVTRSGEALRDRLTRLSLDAAGEDRLAALRASFAATPLDDPSAAREALEVEQRVVRTWQDELLGTLLDLPRLGNKRALFLATAGYDGRPELFYRAVGETDAVERPSETSRPNANEFSATDQLGRTLASYGWITFALRTRIERPTVGGWGIGKFRIVGPSSAGLGIRAFYDGLLDPALAEGYLSLGKAHLAAGSLEDAAECFENALFHFRDRKQTRARQGAALAGLAEVRTRQSRPTEARLAAAEAVALDPTLAAALPAATVALLDAPSTLRQLTAPTSGAILETDSELEASIAALGRRIRLTFQLAGSPGDDEKPLAVRAAPKGFEVRAPAWCRTSTPRSIAELRARRLLARGDSAGDLTPRAQLARGDTGASEVVLRLPATTETAADLPPTAYRTTLAIADSNGGLRLRHSYTSAQAREGWSQHLELPEVEDGALVAVVIEDLATGRWGGEILEVPPFTSTSAQ